METVIANFCLSVIAHFSQSVVDCIFTHKLIYRAEHELLKC